MGQGQRDLGERVHLRKGQLLAISQNVEIRGHFGSPGFLAQWVPPPFRSAPCVLLAWDILFISFRALTMENCRIGLWTSRA